MTDILPASAPAATDPAIDLATWEAVDDRATMPARPTPFTWSILAQTLNEALQRTARQLNLPWHDGDMPFCLYQGRPHRRRDSNLDGPAEPAGRGGLLAQWGLGNQSHKANETTLTAASEHAARISRWYDRVRQTHWGQADLLQVMEEIENLGNNVQAVRLQLAIMLRAADGRVQQWQQEVWSDATPSSAADLTGHVTSYEEALASSGRDAAARASLWSIHGHRGPEELELAVARWVELAPDTPLDWTQFGASGYAGFAARQRAAEQTLTGQAGFLKRRGVEADLQWRRRIATLFDAVDDARARWLAGTRTWAVAAAQEAAGDGRIAQAADIFLLELEEVKQLMTGEWNITHRESLQELVAQRQQDIARWA